MQSSVAGKVGELKVWVELMKRGCHVYLPIADVGIDAMVENRKGRVFRVGVQSRGHKDYNEASHSPTYFIVPEQENMDFFIASAKFQKADQDDYEESYWIFPLKEKREGLKPFLMSSGGIELIQRVSGHRELGTRADILKDFKNSWEQISEGRSLSYPSL